MNLKLKPHCHRDIILENTSFNTSYWAGYSLEEFIEECIRDKIFEEYRYQVELLKRAHELIINDTA
jgi:hypothetical protein